MNYRGVLLLLITVLSIGGAGATLVAAAPPDRTATRTTNVFLFVFDPETGSSVSVFPDQNGQTRVCVSTFTGWGCAWVPDTVLTVDNKLVSASLAPTTVIVEMCNYDSGYPSCTYDEVTVAVTFDGTSDLMRSQSRYKSKNGCLYMFSGKTLARTGAATVTIDGQSHDAEGYLSVSTNTIREQCKG